MKHLMLPDNFKDILEKELLEQVQALLKTTITTDSVTLKASIGKIMTKENPIPKLPKQTINISDRAYLQLQLLIQQYSHEVAGHCTAWRDAEDPNVFYVDEVLTYPQNVSGAFVESNDDGYGPWLMTLPDHTFDNLRMQFHSHVNMSTTPSGTDNNFFASFLPHIKDFYIFMIMNKKGELHLEIHDKERNLLFTDGDIEYDIITEDGASLFDWLDDSAEHMHKKAPPVAPVPAANSPAYTYTRDEMLKELQRQDEYDLAKPYGGAYNAKHY